MADRGTDRRAQPGLDEVRRSGARAYVASFFEIIGSPQRRQDDIIEECRLPADRS